MSDRENGAPARLSRVEAELDRLPERYVNLGQFTLFQRTIEQRLNRLEAIVLGVGGTTIVLLLSVLLRTPPRW